MESLYYDDGGDRMENLLHRKFFRPQKTIIGEGGGILSAVDDRLFAAFELLYHSVSLSHEVPIAVVDLGMLPSQRQWCLERGLEIMDLSEEDLIFEREMPNWQNWNKPLYIERSPFPHTLYLDADLLVRGSLSLFFRLIKEDVFVVEDAHPSPGFTSANEQSVYRFRRLFVPEGRRATIFPNVGVLGMCPQRDRDLIEAWKVVTRLAREDDMLRRMLSWYDQGAFICALEMLDRLDVIRPHEWTFNYPHRPPDKKPWGAELRDICSFLNTLPDKDSALIRHCTGPWKPYYAWKFEPIHTAMPDPCSGKLRVLALSHSPRHFEFLTRRPFLVPTNLSLLPLGPRQKNELAESRIYLTPDLMDRFEGREYVGLASTSWDEKYVPEGVLRLRDLHRLKDHLRPDVVYAGCMTKYSAPWTNVTCTENRGLERMLSELAEFTGMPLLNGPSFWSNNFICHREVLEDYVRHFRRVFEHFSAKYNNRFDFDSVDNRRTPAYFYEAVTVQYFANRRDLSIRRAIDPRLIKC